jgi:hypothetical protein
VENADKPRLLLDSVLLGVVGGLSAQLLVWMQRLSGHVFLIWLAGHRPPVLPVDGGCFGILWVRMDCGFYRSLRPWADSFLAFLFMVWHLRQRVTVRIRL